MGRDVTGLLIEKMPSSLAKSNGINQVKVHIDPKVTVESIGTNGFEADDHNSKRTAVEDGHEKQDVLAVKSTNYGSGFPDAKVHKVDALKTNEKKLNSPVKLATASTATDTLQTSPSTPTTPNLSPEKQNLGVNGIGGESVSGIVKNNSLYSPKSPMTSQPTLSLNSRTLRHDEEDNLSLASSAATSVRTIKSRITVPVAPSFVCGARAERRKEYYTKLDEKHKALEKEKLEYAARTKEEEAAAIKQLRKNMIYKANPVPSFYHEGPPPKVELKKLPVTRAKSPNLTRRKSCSDATKSTPEHKAVCDRAKRHSFGVDKEGSTAPNTPKNKDVTGRRKSTPGVGKEGNTASPAATKSKSMLSRRNGIEVNKSKGQPKQVKETSKASRTKGQAGAGSDISVVEEVTKTAMTVEHIADIAVAAEVSKYPHVTTEEMSTDITISEEVKKPSPTMAEQKSAGIAVET